MICLITQIKVKKFSTLIGSIISFLSMQRKAKTVQGLLETIILLRPQRTLLLISLWKDASAIADFATAVPEHPMVVHKVYRVDAEVWSGFFLLQNASVGISSR